MSVLHDIVYAIAGLVSSPLWGYRLLRTGKWRTDWPARFGKTAPLPPFAGKTILLHAVSVGEVNALRLLVRELEERVSGFGCRVSEEQKAGQPNSSLPAPDTPNPPQLEDSQRRALDNPSTPNPSTPNPSTLLQEAVLHKVIDMMSCKAAVKAGDKLTPQELEALLAKRQEIERSSSCPHGRPTTLRLSLRDLEKQFKRG